MFLNSQLYIFDGLSSEELSYFALMCDPINYDSWAIVMRESDKSDNRAYFIEAWKAEVIKDGKVIAILSEGDLFGEIALITNDDRTATIRAASDLQVLALHRDDFLLLAKKSGRFPEIQKEIFRRIQENFSR
jgi:CRP-like cAMP-binding protein